MLQSLREHVQGWIAVVIAGILGLAFALWGIEYYIGNGPTEVVVAKVNGEKITQNQLEVAYNRARQAQQLSGNSADNETLQKQIKTRALNGLVQQQVLTRAANKAGYVISPVQVGALLQQMPAFQMNGQFSYDLFQRTLMNLSYTPEMFAQEIGKSALLQQVQLSLVESNFALADDLNRYVSLLSQKRNFAYMQISPTSFLANTPITDQAIADYYKANSQKFTTSEQVSLQYLLLSTDTQKTDQWVAEQSDKLAELTYTHPDTLKFAGDALGLPIQTTALFTRQGEKTGLLSNPKILSTAFSDNVLKQRNNSDIISLDDHTVIVVRVADHKPVGVKPLLEVRAEIEKILKQQMAQKAAMALGEKIIQDMKQGASPQKLALQNKLTWMQKNNVDRGAKDIPPEILKIAFNQPAPGSNKAPVFYGQNLSEGGYVILMVNAVIEEALTSVTADQRLSLQKQMNNDFGALDYELYLAQEISKAKIKMSE